MSKTQSIAALEILDSLQSILVRESVKSVWEAIIFGLILSVLIIGLASLFSDWSQEITTAAMLGQVRASRVARLEKRRRSLRPPAFPIDGESAALFTLNFRP